MDSAQIEAGARDLHRLISQQRRHIWQARRPRLAELIDLLDPSYAAAILGIHFQEREHLGRFGSGRDRFEVAGSLDRPERKISVSRKFPPETMRFTGAHELGHWQLHPGQIMLRERPIKGVGLSELTRSGLEREADYFATFTRTAGSLSAYS